MDWYKVEVPKNIIARPGDAVSYYAITDNKGKEVKTSHMQAACYHGHMASLTKYTFDCIPCNVKTSILPAEDFFLWMKFCAAFGFSPSGTIPYTKKDMNCCLIHGVGECKHRIYAGLCCYRWAECLAPMVYEACRLIEKRPELSFYRIMHYITGKYVTLVGHSFTNVSGAAMSLYGYGGSKVSPRLDLLWGLIPKYFFDPGINMAAKANQTANTQITLQSEIQKMNLNVSVKKHEEILDDKWTELFAMPQLTGVQIKEYYDSVMPKALQKKAA